jgi:protein ImuB
MHGVAIDVGTHVVNVTENDLAIGIADSIFASRLAARFSMVVALGETANFLSDLPLSYCGMHPVVDALEEFGIRRVGEFLRLDPRDVANRFGREGRRFYGWCALTEDEDPARDRIPTEGAMVCRFDEDLDGVEQVVFAVSRVVAARYERFAGEGTSPTTVDVAIHCDAGSLVRRWHFPDGSLPTEVIDRLRWQIEGMVRQRAIDGQTAEVWDAWAVREVVLTPVTVAAHQGRQLDLDGDRTSSEEVVLRALAKLSARLGEDGVQMIAEDAGRAPRERYRLVPWQPSAPDEGARQGSRSQRVNSRRLDPKDDHAGRMPWPGSVPGPQPAVVYEAMVPVDLRDEDGRSVTVNGRGLLSAEPVLLHARSGGYEVVRYRGPWPVEERWWDPRRQRRYVRLMIELDDGSVHLILGERLAWFVEATYE